jgi:hypothetical protein
MYRGRIEHSRLPLIGWRRTQPQDRGFWTNYRRSLSLTKAMPSNKSGDSAHQVDIDTALRLGKFQGHASYLLMAVPPKRV